jgi:FkbM family methyltransferase
MNNSIKIDLRDVIQICMPPTAYKPFSWENGIKRHLQTWHHRILSENSSHADFQLIFSNDIQIKIIGTHYSGVSPLHLISPQEIMIFAKYFLIEPGRGGNFLDLGANIGLHSILLSKLGFKATCYEPDPITYSRLLENVKANNVDVCCENYAIVARKMLMDTSPTIDFVRVLDNPTASGLALSEKNFYGKLETVQVKAKRIKDLDKKWSIIKIDIEGSEASVFEELHFENIKFDYLCMEISTESSSKMISEILQEQTRYNWFVDGSTDQNPVASKLPRSWRDGSLHIIGR